MKRILKALSVALLACASVSYAQTWATVTPEDASASLTIPAGTTYRLGNVADNKWSAPVTVATDATFSPVSMGVANTFPFSDPDSGQVKVFQVLETLSKQTVMLNGAAVNIPALVATCPLPPTPASGPTADDANPVSTSNDPVCALPTGVIFVGTTGYTINIGYTSAPVFMIYCVGSQCGKPFLWIKEPVPVDPSNPMLHAGGLPNGTGTLFVFPSVGPFSVLATDASSNQLSPQIVSPTN